MNANPAPESPLSQLFSQFLRTWNYGPVTSWDHVFNPQFIISANGGDAAVENDVLKEVGSYGHQLGIIMDALRVLVADKVTAGNVLPDDRLTFDRFKKLADRVDDVVASQRPRRRTGVTAAEVDDLVERLRQLQRDDPEAARALSDRIGQALAPVAMGPGVVAPVA